MMDLIPILIDGAVVFNLQNACHIKSMNCENCVNLALNLHNWIRYSELEYTIVDLQDEKDICPSFLEELLFLRKRLRQPFLFAGVMEKAQEYLEGYHHKDAYPVFITPEDAVRALRILHPGLTETTLKYPIKFGYPLLLRWRQMQGEVLGLG